MEHLTIEKFFNFQLDSDKSKLENMQIIGYSQYSIFIVLSAVEGGERREEGGGGGGGGGGRGGGTRHLGNIIIVRLRCVSGAFRADRGKRGGEKPDISA